MSTPKYLPRIILSLVLLHAITFTIAQSITLSVHGEGWGFVVAPPSNWTLDRRSLHKYGIEGLFLPAEAAYAPDKLYLCILNPGTKLAAAEVATDNLKPNGEVETASFQKVALFSAGTKSGSQQRLLGILDDGGHRFVFFLSASSPALFEQGKMAFHELISSFVLLEPE